MLPDWAPNIHPVMVHFPIVLLLAAILFDTAGLFLKRNNLLERTAIILYVAGTIAAFITIYTGDLAAESLNIPEAIRPHVHHHEEWAETTIWFFSIYTVIRTLVYFKFASLHKALLTLLVLASFIGGYFLYKTGDHGGELVYGYGLGTGTFLNGGESGHHHEEGGMPDSSAAHTNEEHEH